MSMRYHQYIRHELQEPSWNLFGGVSPIEFTTDETHLIIVWDSDEIKHQVVQQVITSIYSSKVYIVIQLV